MATNIIISTSTIYIYTQKYITYIYHNTSNMDFSNLLFEARQRQLNLKADAAG